MSIEGSIDWACLPRFDSASAFARVLDPSAGHWSLAPTAEVREVTRAYVDDTLVVRTEQLTDQGRISVHDALLLGPDEHGHEIGRRSPHVLVRVVDGIDGEVEVCCDLQARPEYGLTVPTWAADAGRWRSLGGPVALVLSTDAELEVVEGGLLGTVTLRAGDRTVFALRARSPWDDDPESIAPGDIGPLLARTVEGWQSWARLHGGYDGPYAEQVRLSGRVLQGLTYAPSGAVVAAPTTSLPEEIGGSRNWDYRFAWVRDASLTLQALWVAACPDEAGAFFNFFATAAGGGLDDSSALQILYGVGGERHVPEATLTHLAGFRGSTPVRIGNGAWDQLQLDVYGELLDAALLLADQVGTFDEASRALLVGAADTAARRWREPDEGIWEIRGGRSHFLYSKLMCWLALDRACQLADRIDAEARVDGWRAEAERIREAILTEGWNAEVGAFTQSLGSSELDASALMILIVGFLPADDPRVVSTVEAVAEKLTDERGFVYRYRSTDGIEGGEGTFTICTFWLAQCWAMMGRIGDARALFEATAGCANDLGLLSEQIDPDSGSLIGNFPQAFTHIGLINAAWAITEAETAAAATRAP